MIKVAILSYGSVVYDSQNEKWQSFPTEEEAVEFLRERDQNQITNGGNDDE